MSGFVYFLGCGDFVKVGHSTRLDARIRDISTCSPHDLTLLAAFPGSQDDEARVHDYLSAHRYRGEWFRRGPDIDAILIQGLPCWSRPTNPIQAAIERAIQLAGSEAKLGEGTGFSQVAINKAKHRGSVSAEMALALHRFTGGAVPASDLRPDLWQSPDDVPLAPCQQAAS